MNSYINGEVAITKYEGNKSSVGKGIELIQGFEDLMPSHHVLIKPNIVWSAGGTAPKYGMITNTRLVEDVVVLLRGKGCTHISIGEGSPVNEEIGASTVNGFYWSGIAKLAKKYGIKLIDFNDSHVQVKLGKKKVEIARSVVEADFWINMPVLKTHSMTKVSLGMKNLKGCLSMKSKKKFHMLDLNEMIASLNTQLKPDLTIIDGIYAMERGPLSTGRAHRLNLIITGKDVFSCDLVGSTILGVDPATVPHLTKFAEVNGRPLGVETVDIMGEEIRKVRNPLEWQFDIEDYLHTAGVNGITVQWPGNRFCTSCVLCAGFMLTCFCKDNAGIEIDPIEICFGAEVKAKDDSEKVLLIGDCAIRANRAKRNAITVEGCPPSILQSMKSLMDATLSKARARRILATRMAKAMLNRIGIYNEKFPREFTYNLPDFDPKHYLPS